MSHKVDLDALDRMYQKANCPALPFSLESQIRKEACGSAIYNQFPALIAELRELREREKRIAELEAERDKWKNDRIHWQDIVYEVCNFIDSMDGNSPSLGEGVLAEKGPIIAALNRLSTHRNEAMDNSNGWRKRAADLKAERDTLLRSVATLREALEAAANRIESIMETEPHLHLKDDLALYRRALANPGATEAIERVRNLASAEWITAFVAQIKSDNPEATSVWIDALEDEAAELRGGQ